MKLELSAMPSTTSLIFLSKFSTSPPPPSHEIPAAFPGFQCADFTLVLVEGE